MEHKKGDVYEKKTMSGGKSNPKYVDLLDEDKSIAGQKFVCVSFVSPENTEKYYPEIWKKVTDKNKS